MSATLKATWNTQSLSPRESKMRRICEVVRRAYEQRGAAKAIARDASSDSRTAESWLYGCTAPRSVELVDMMASNEQLEAEITALVREIRERKNCSNAPSHSPSAVPSRATTSARRPPSSSAC
jgi:hypothetical protein